MNQLDVRYVELKKSINNHIKIKSRQLTGLTASYKPELLTEEEVPE
jgi:ribosomal protein S18